MDKNDKRINIPAKVVAFCERYGIPTETGTTKHGKPWKQRRDVHLNSWNKKRAELRAEEEKLKDAADKLTADTDQFENWRREDEDASK